jgi:hypothetical protein
MKTVIRALDDDHISIATEGKNSNVVIFSTTAQGAVALHDALRYWMHNGNSESGYLDLGEETIE